MKKLLLLLFIPTLLIGCSYENDGSQQGNSEGNTDSDLESIEKETPETITVNGKELQGLFVVKVEDLMRLVDGSYEYDETHRTLTMSIYDTTFKLISEVPVLEKNGVFLAEEDILLILDDEGTPYVTDSFIEKGLQADRVSNTENNSITFVWEDDEVVETFTQMGNERVDLYSMSVEEMIEFLSFLKSPIEGASVSTLAGHLPGAPRAYRNGYHEGIDWYDFASGGNISTDTPIYAMGEGIVVRADHDFEEYSSPEERNADLAIAAEVGITPDYILDRLRGKQVWVQYPNGVMNRFAHLYSIPSELQVGDQVDVSTIIGYVGNTGTSHSVEHNGGGLHLHQDLLIYGDLFWKPFSPEEVLEILITIWE